MATDYLRVLAHWSLLQTHQESREFWGFLVFVEFMGCLEFLKFLRFYMLLGMFGFLGFLGQGNEKCLVFQMCSKTLELAGIVDFLGSHAFDGS